MYLVVCSGAGSSPIGGCDHQTDCVVDYMGLINKVDMVCLSPVGYGV